MKALALSEQRDVVGDAARTIAQKRREARWLRGQRGLVPNICEQEVQKRKKAASDDAGAARRDRDLRRVLHRVGRARGRRQVRVGPLLVPRLRRAAARPVAGARPGGGRRAREGAEVLPRASTATDGCGTPFGLKELATVLPAAAFDGLQAKNVELAVHLGARRGQGAPRGGGGVDGPQTTAQYETDARRLPPPRRHVPRRAGVPREAVRRVRLRPRPQDPLRRYGGAPRRRGPRPAYRRTGVPAGHVVRPLRPPQPQQLGDVARLDGRARHRRRAAGAAA